MTGIRARPVRVTRRGSRARAARITFRLNAPGRVVFVIRGPAPSCGVAGKFSVRGERGVNHVRFTGKLGRRNLPYGTYRITARTRGRAPSRPVVVVVGERESRDRFACAPPVVDFDSILTTFSTGGGTPGTGGAEAGATGSGAQRSEAKKPGAGVLPAVKERLRQIPEALPRPGMPAASESPSWLVGLGALLLLVLSGLALLLYVLRFVRRAHTL